MAKSNYNELIEKESKIDEFSIRKLALRLYFFGMPKLEINKKLHLEKYKLDKWIAMEFGTIKELAMTMYYFGRSKKEICDDLDIRIAKFNSWIDSSSRSNNSVKRQVVQDGFSPWVTEIINSCLYHKIG